MSQLFARREASLTHRLFPSTGFLDSSNVNTLQSGFCKATCTQGSFQLSSRANGQSSFTASAQSSNEFARMRRASGLALRPRRLREETCGIGKTGSGTGRRAPDCQTGVTSVVSLW